MPLGNGLMQLIIGVMPLINIESYEFSDNRPNDYEDPKKIRVGIRRQSSAWNVLRMFHRPLRWVCCGSRTQIWETQFRSLSRRLCPISSVWKWRRGREYKGFCEAGDNIEDLRVGSRFQKCCKLENMCRRPEHLRSLCNQKTPDIGKLKIQLYLLLTSKLFF